MHELLPSACMQGRQCAEKGKDIQIRARGKDGMKKNTPSPRPAGQLTRHHRPLQHLPSRNNRHPCQRPQVHHPPPAQDAVIHCETLLGAHRQTLSESQGNYPRLKPGCPAHMLQSACQGAKCTCGGLASWPPETTADCNSTVEQGQDGSGTARRLHCAGSPGGRAGPPPRVPAASAPPAASPAIPSAGETSSERAE